MTAIVDAGYLALIASDRVSTRTRAALLDRAGPDDAGYRPAAMTMEALTTLRAVCARLVAQSDAGTIDLAARIDAALAMNSGDGWRFAVLPPDRHAYRDGLATLDAAARATHGTSFAGMPPEAQDAMLAAAAAGELPAGDGLDAAALKLWIEELRADAVRHYVAHPATLGRMGYSGVGYGGDGPDKPGFHELEPGRSEEWEPIAAADRR